MRGEGIAAPAAGRFEPSPVREAQSRGRTSRLGALSRSLGSPTPYLMAFGLGLWLLLYWAATEGLKLPRFEKMPGPANIVNDLFARHPEQGMSVFVDLYWEHIFVSCRRVFYAFCLATCIGVPLGLLMGWSRPRSWRCCGPSPSSPGFPWRS